MRNDSMNETNQKIIAAIIKKAETVCPDSLALIGLYGSAATGDTYEKSDIDLMIVINDELGRQLADAFILNDVGIGYDIYCTSWEMLEEDARCNHAHLSKLLDAALVYKGAQAAVERLEGLRKRALSLLASDQRYQKAQRAFDNAKKMYADVFMSDAISQIRVCAGTAINFLLDSVMLYHGKYFRKGVKRTFDELKALPLSFNMEEKIMDIIRAETKAEIRNSLTALMRNVQELLLLPCKKAEPAPDNISGTYEEMFSNWRNKMQEASERDDLFSSFMNMVSLQSMSSQLAKKVAVSEFDILNHFDPGNLGKNLKIFDSALDGFLEEYRKAGIQPKCFSTIDDFIANYLKITV